MPGGQADAAQVPCGGLLTEMVAAVTAPSACDIPLVSGFLAAVVEAESGFLGSEHALVMAQHQQRTRCSGPTAGSRHHGIHAGRAPGSSEGRWNTPSNPAPHRPNLDPSRALIPAAPRPRTVSPHYGRCPQPQVQTSRVSGLQTLARPLGSAAGFTFNELSLPLTPGFPVHENLIYPAEWPRTSGKQSCYGADHPGTYDAVAPGWGHRGCPSGALRGN